MLRAPSRPSHRAVVAADPPATSADVPGDVGAREHRPGRREDDIDHEIAQHDDPRHGRHHGPAAARSARAVGPRRSEARHAAMVPARPAGPSDRGPRPTMTALPHAPTPELPDDRRDARPRPPRHRHDPDALDRWRPAGELGAPGRPDGRRADGLRPLDALPPPRPDPPGLARPRPLRPQRRPRQHAAVLAAPPHRLRPLARRPQAVPPVGQPDARPPRIRPDAGRRGDHRPAGPGAGERDRDGHRRAPPRGRVQPRRPRRSSTTGPT